MEHIERPALPAEIAEQLQFQTSLLRLVYQGATNAGARAEHRAAEIEQLLGR